MNVKKKIFLCMVFFSILFSVGTADIGNSSTYKLAVQENNFAGSGNSTNYNVSVDSGLSGQGNGSSYRINLGLVTFLATFGAGANTTPIVNVSFSSLSGEAIVYQDTTVHFQITVSNTGNVNTSVIPRLYIFDSSNNLVFQRTGSSSSLTANSTISLLQYNSLVFSVGSTAVGTYNATINIQYIDENNVTQVTQNRSVIFEIRAAASSGGGGSSSGGGGGSSSGGGGGGTTAPPPEERPPVSEEEGTGSLVFNRAPLWIDLSAGEEYVDVITIHNLRDTELSNLNFFVQGVSDWITLPDGQISIEAQGNRDVPIVINIPDSIRTGSYLAKILIQNAGIYYEYSLVLRIVTPLSVESEQIEDIFVKQNIYINLEDKKTYVNIKVRNGNKYAKNLSYTRTISKTVASSVDEINFLTPPSRIINPDPVVEWLFYNVTVYEERNISYYLEKVIGLASFSDPTIYQIFVSVDRQYIETGSEFTILSVIVILAAVVGALASYHFIHSKKRAHYPRGFKRFIGKPILGSESGKTLGLVKDITFMAETGEVFDIIIKNPTPYAQRFLKRGKNEIYVPFQSLKGAADYVVVTEKDIIRNPKWYEEYKEA